MAEEMFDAPPHHDSGNANLATTPQRCGIPAKVAKFMARHPYKCSFGTLILCIILTLIVAVKREVIDLYVDATGWRSRSTLISLREMQNHIVERNVDKLFEDYNGTVWDDLETNIFRGFEVFGLKQDETEAEDEETYERRSLRRELFIDGCNSAKYYSTMFVKDNLFAVYKTEANLETSSKSILDTDVLFEICESETITHERLEANGICGGCDDGTQCLPPHSLLLVLRLRLGALNSSCNELKKLYTDDVKTGFTTSLMECAQEIHTNYNSTTKTYDMTKCPNGFQPNLIDKDFGINGNTLLRYTSSYFITYQTNEELVYDAGPYGQTDETIVTVVYDSVTQGHNELYALSKAMSDMVLAMGSLCITFIAIATHTKSIWLTFVGVLQIFLSIPIAIFVYVFIAGISFFPFLNLIGVFVAAALGADDVFVAVDKWKNARLAKQSASTEEIAAIALPNAASAMLLTTSTTAVAFFATMICPVTPILCFALFCGMLIIFNYVLNMFLVFPAICLYDIWLMRGSRNILVNFGCCTKSIVKTENSNENITKRSLIHKILDYYYKLLHKVRYGVLVGCIIATIVCIYFGLKIKLPESADVKVLPDNNVIQVHSFWRKELLL